MAKINIDKNEEARVTRSKEQKGPKPYIFAVGRRREAVARVRLYNPSNGKAQILGAEYKKGDMVVNGKPIQEYFRFIGFGPRYNKILRDTDTSNKFIFSSKVAGGGLSGQLDAIVHGIARALDKLDKETYHKILRDQGYLTRDDRVKERRKVGNAGKARRKKSSPKR